MTLNRTVMKSAVGISRNLSTVLWACGLDASFSLKVEVKTGKDAGGAPIYSTIKLAPVLAELTRIVQARNVFGAHFNALSFELLEGDALGFGEQVLQLMDALTDADTGWPKDKRSGSYWATAGESRKLHPLQQPA